MVKKIGTTLHFSLGEYTTQVTDDGSQTLYSSYFDETCHSGSGAYDETNHNYIQGCEIKQKALKQSEIVVFEVGFGTGIGLKCTLDQLKDSSTPLSFYSCELDEKLAYNSMESLGISYEVINLNEKFKYIKAAIANREIIVLLGDVRESFPLAREKDLLKKFDAIYQDAFSPKNNPWLWTYEWFHDLASLSKDTTLMTTYSTTKATWKSMILAGWRVECITGFRKKRMSTRAKRQGESASDVLEWTAQSPINALKDENINGFTK